MVKLERTRWGSDVCACSIYFTWDSHVPAEKRVHTGVEIGTGVLETHPEGTVRCDAHRKHSDPHKHFLAVMEESGRRQEVYHMLLDHLVQTGQHRDKLVMRTDELTGQNWWTIHPSCFFHTVFHEEEGGDGTGPRSMDVDILSVQEKKSVLSKETKSVLQARIDSETSKCSTHEGGHGKTTMMIQVD